MTRLKQRPANPVFDRRLFARTPAARAAKVFHRAGMAFAPGETRDLSEGGARLDIRSTREFEPGDVIDLVIEPKEPGVVRTRSLVEAHVVSAERLDHERQVLRVRFARQRAEFAPSVAA